jgi:hypothetical protein
LVKPQSRNKRVSYTGFAAIRFPHAEPRVRRRLFQSVQNLRSDPFGRSRRFSGIHVNVVKVVQVVHIVQVAA